MNERDETKLRVKAAVNLAEFIGQEIELKKAGEWEWKARCPFHDDHTPSFTVFWKNGMWAFHCFGCDADGDLFEWIMRRQGVAFPQALTMAANHAGICLDEPARRLYQPPEVRAAAVGPEPSRGAFSPEKYRALTEGSPAYGLARKISAERVYKKKYGGSYAWFHQREHLNRVWEILEELHPYFIVESRRFFPLPFLPFIFCNLFVGLTLRPRLQPLAV